MAHAGSTSTATSRSNWHCYACYDRICEQDTHPDDTQGLASQVQAQNWSKLVKVGQSDRRLKLCALASQIQSRTGTASQVLVQGATSNAQCATSRARLVTSWLAVSTSLGLRIANEKLPGSKCDMKERKKEAAWHSCTTSS